MGAIIEQLKKHFKAIKKTFKKKSQKIKRFLQCLLVKAKCNNIYKIVTAFL